MPCQDPDLPMVDPLMQKQLRSKKKDSLAPGKPKKSPKPNPTKAMKVSGKAKGKQPAERSTGADAASSKKDLRKRKQDGEAVKGKLGCPKCRYIAGGCSNCRNPNYRPRGPRKSRPATRGS